MWRCGAKIISKPKELINENNINAPNIKCPKCRTKNATDQVSCKKCGKDLTETLGYFKGGYSSNKMFRMDKDIEITYNEVIFI